MRYTAALFHTMLKLLTSQDRVSENDVTAFFSEEELEMLGSDNLLIRVFRHYTNTALQEYAFGDAVAAFDTLQKLLSIPLFRRVSPDLYERISWVHQQADQEKAMEYLGYLSQRLYHFSLIWCRQDDCAQRVQEVLAEFPAQLIHPDIANEIENIRMSLSMCDLARSSKRMKLEETKKKLETTLDTFRKKVAQLSSEHLCR